ncbi:hypothetical protein [Pontibacter actiniarum]|uniref:DUF5666 domain-containing protein n=1 Tax=Pontibacter actiniarum TaxID=323450 RepID=A0A1X9YNZ8_9BACT|nr:hypothetical protein [Pontibacter actiniarum]ARS34585.1 hypothetical protein CA264_03515 [Pontibacter actiniarum]
MKYLQKYYFLLLLLTTLSLTGCRTSTSATDAATAEGQRLSPQRVDIRGTIVTSRYDQGQVMLEVEAFGASPESRYNRAYVLVLPTTQIIGPDGQSISLSEIRQGQHAAVLIRGGGQGNQVGMGVARKVWIEDTY